MKKQCAHPICPCEHDRERMFEQDGQLYCSNHCASAPEDASGCNCGHPECGS